MNCGYIVVLLVSLFAAVKGFEYKFQRDAYIMNGCPRHTCQGDRIPARCRMPTIFTTKEGKRCRGCPMNICTNHIFKTPVFTGSRNQVPDTFNPLSDRAPKQLPEVYKAMEKGYLDQQADVFTPRQRADVIPQTNQILLDQQADVFTTRQRADVMPQTNQILLDQQADVFTPRQRADVMPQTNQILDVLPSQQFDPRPVPSIQDFSSFLFPNQNQVPMDVLPNVNAQVRMNVLPNVNEQLQYEPFLPIVHSGYHAKGPGCLHS